LDPLAHFLCRSIVAPKVTNSEKHLMAQDDDDSKNVDAGNAAASEYELAVKTQMHFNEILMKFRSFGITVVMAVYSYAVSRPPSEISTVIGAAPSQVVGSAGLILTVLFAFIDLFYFFPLLLGAVGRCLELEKTTTYRLTSTISKAVPQARAYKLIAFFYAAIAITGVVLVFFVLPTTGVVSRK